MLRDSVGGRAVNLLPGDQPNDIYQQVADKTAERIKAQDPSKLTDSQQAIREKWLAHGINRTLVKRSVMTLPYGSSKYSSEDFVVSDYLKHGMAPEFEPIEYARAGGYLAGVLWGAIEEVIQSAPKVMAWLQKSVAKILHDSGDCITWVTPTGFPVAQVYNDVDVVSIRTLLFGGARVRVGTTGKHASVRRHRNGISPNFVHSLDEAHLVMSVLACKEAGINSLAMIHDDYGTHAADAEKLYRIIRETFVRLYSDNDPIGQFYADHPGIEQPPERGDLDIRNVLDSQYFFA
jgi:DNA-directed RNA polymerase